MSLGFGVGFRPPHYRWVIENRPAVDWFEVISENFIALGGRPRRFLAQLRERYPVVLHGVSLSIASPEPLRENYLRDLRELADWLEPALVSDHLCWTRLGAHNSHDLLPVPLTRAMLAHVGEKVSRAQEALGRRLLLENASAYVAFAANELGEAEFMRELCRRTGCGVLLDLNNLVVNEHNLGVDAGAYLEALGPDDVGQFHLGGHSLQGAIRVDTHDAPVTDEAWELYRRAAARWPDAPTLIEWDAKIPEFARLQAECDLARAIARDARGAAPAIRPRSLDEVRMDLRAAPPIGDADQRALLTVVTAEASVALESLGVLDSRRPVSAYDGAIVYRSGYVHRLRDTLGETFSALAFVCGEEGFAELVDAYLARCAPTHDSIKYAGECLAAFLRETGVDFDFGVPQTALADLAAFEWAMAEVFDSPEPAGVGSLDPAALATISPDDWTAAKVRCRLELMRVLRVGFDVGPVWQAVARGEVPAPPSAGEFSYLIYRHDEAVHWDALEPACSSVIEALSRGASLGEAACELLERGVESDPAAAVNQAVLALRFLLDRSLVAAIAAD